MAELLRRETFSEGEVEGKEKGSVGPCIVDVATTIASDRAGGESEGEETASHDEREECRAPGDSERAASSCSRFPVAG